jgi:hypothetical protein
VVAYVGNELRGFGNLLLIKHADGWMTAYAHNDAILVGRGAKVKRGQTVARVGDSGSVVTPQLHFEVRRGTRAVDPAKQLGPRQAAQNWCLIQLDALAAGQVLDELPGDPAVARAAGDRPFLGLGPEPVWREV